MDISKQLVERILSAFNTKRQLIAETMDRPIVILWSLHFVKMYQNATLCFINMYNYMPSLKVYTHTHTHTHSHTSAHMCGKRESMKIAQISIVY